MILPDQPSSVRSEILRAAWNALTTAAILTLLAGMFIIALPSIYRATAVIPYDEVTRDTLASKAFLHEVVADTKLDLSSVMTLSQLASAMVESTDPITRLSANLRFEQTPATISISIDALNPDLAAGLLVEIGSYLQRHRPDSEISELEIAAGLRVESARERIREFIESNPDASSTEHKLASLLHRKSANADAIQQTMLDLEKLNMSLAQITSGDFSSLLKDPAVLRVLNLKDKTVMKKAELKTRYGPAHRSMIGVEEELVAANKLVDQQTNLAKERLKLELEQSRKLLAAKQKELSVLELEEAKLHQLEQALGKLRDELKIAGNNYNQIVQKHHGEFFENAIVTRNLIGSRIGEVLMLIFAGCSLIIMAILYLGYWLRSASPRQHPESTEK